MRITVEIYRNRKKEFFWRARSRNGKIIAVGGEGYKRKGACLSIVKKLFYNDPPVIAYIFDLSAI